MVWNDSYGLIEVGHRSLDVAFPQFRNPAVIVGHDITGIAFQRLVEVGQCRIEVPFSQPEIPPVVKRRRQSWNELERTRVVRNCLRSVAASFLR